jgi:hypothetical protein
MMTTTATRVAVKAKAKARPLPAFRSKPFLPRSLEASKTPMTTIDFIICFVDQVNDGS